MSMVSINPATGEKEKEFNTHSDQFITDNINTGYSVFNEWRGSTFAERSRLFRNLANVLRETKEESARIMVKEMGKTITQAIAEAEKCAWVADYYAEKGEEFLTDFPIETEAQKSYVSFQPLGIILGIMPWNFPFWQVFRFAVPTIMAGNTAILKHASNVPESAVMIEEIFRKAGFPENVFKTMLISSKQIPLVMSNPYVQGVSLTGSTPAGKNVASLAGNYMKKAVLELGGSDPYIVLEDADIEMATESSVTARLINNGQSCIAAKRFIVHKSIRNQFEEAFVEKVKQKKMGDPMEETNDLGPIARDDLRDELHDQVTRSINGGAKVLAGGDLPSSKGFFYPVTVLSDVKPGMAAWDEETFGPVAPITYFETDEEAARLANDNPFGLGAAVFSEDIERAEKLARNEIHAGSVFINDFVKSDPRLPFGGIKESGFGRELSMFGIREFTNIKTIRIR